MRSFIVKVGNFVIIAIMQRYKSEWQTFCTYKSHRKRTHTHTRTKQLLCIALISCVSQIQISFHCQISSGGGGGGDVIIGFLYRKLQSVCDYNTFCSHFKCWISCPIAFSNESHIFFFLLCIATSAQNDERKALEDTVKMVNAKKGNGKKRNEEIETLSHKAINQKMKFSTLETEQPIKINAVTFDKYEDTMKYATGSMQTSVEEEVKSNRKNEEEKNVKSKRKLRP